jgi:hypothetical protein
MVALEDSGIQYEIRERAETREPKPDAKMDTP